MNAIWIISLLLVGASQSAPDQAAEAVCGRLLPPAAVAGSVGREYRLRGFAEDGPTWRCTWQRESPSGLLSVGFRIVTAAGTQEYDEYLTGLRRLQLPVEVVPALGSAASQVTLGTSFILAVRRPGVFLTVTTNGPTSEQARAVARSVVAVSDKTVAEARAALVAARAAPTPPVRPLTDVVVRRQGGPFCVKRCCPERNWPPPSVTPIT